MTINSISPISSTAVVGLATQTFNVVTAGIYTVAVNYTIPYIASGTSATSATTTGGSALQLLLKLNGTTKLTLSSPSPTQPVLAGSVVMSCVAGDAITVVPSSANDVDSGLNAVKGIVNVFQGE